MDDYPEIPTGYYCYRVLEVVNQPEGPPKIKTEACPHWQKTEKGARCNLINREDTDYCGFHLIWDGVKECGIKMREPGEEPGKKLPREEAIEEGWEERDEVCPCGKTNRILYRKGSKPDSCTMIPLDPPEGNS